MRELNLQKHSKVNPNAPPAREAALKLSRCRCYFGRDLLFLQHTTVESADGMQKIVLADTMSRLTRGLRRTIHTFQAHTYVRLTCTFTSMLCFSASASCR